MIDSLPNVLYRVLHTFFYYCIIIIIIIHSYLSGPLLLDEYVDWRKSTAAGATKA